MKKTAFSYIFLILATTMYAQKNTSGLKLSNTITLPNVTGGFDLMAADVAGERLFVSAEDNKSLEVIDLNHMTSLKSVSGFKGPQWVAYQPDRNRLYVATALDGQVTVVDSRSFEKIKSFSFKEKCNGLRLDPVKKILYVGVGNTFGSLGVIDIANDKILGEIPLSNYAKQFVQVGQKMYVNVPETNTVEIVDLNLRKVTASWKIKAAKGNVPMGIDRKHQRLFIGCETGKLVVYDLKTEHAIATVDIDKECDGVYYDKKHSKIYISCGEGFIDVVSQISPDNYKMQTKIPTVAGAGTSLFISKMDAFILAVPQNDANKAEIRIYKPID